jgi:drug/metabolite transporter (DMT)-like permease
MPIAYWCLLFVGIILSGFGAILLKMGSVEIIHDGVWRLLQQILINWKILLGVLFYMVPSFIWIFMLKTVDISFLQPMFSLVYIVTPVLAVMILRENIPINRWVGIVVIVLGVFIVARR